MGAAPSAPRTQQRKRLSFEQTFVNPANRPAPFAYKPSGPTRDDMMPFRFLDLPKEIREIIYKHYLVGSNMLINQHYRSFAAKESYHFAILPVCRLTYSEARPILASQLCVAVTSISFLCFFTKLTNAYYIPHLRHLAIEPLSNARLTRNLDSTLKLVSCFPAIESLRIVSWSIYEDTVSGFKEYATSLTHDVLLKKARVKYNKSLGHRAHSLVEAIMKKYEVTVRMILRRWQDTPDCGGGQSLAARPFVEVVVRVNNWEIMTKNVHKGV